MKQSNDNGVLKNPKTLVGYDNQEGSLRFADEVAYGENQKGFTAFTPNGPSRCDSNIYKDNFGKREDGNQSSPPGTKEFVDPSWAED